MTTTKENELLTVGEVAGKRKLSTRAIWKFRDAGTLPSPVKIGRAVRWRASDINAWMDAGCPNCRKTNWQNKIQEECNYATSKNF